MKLHEAFSLHNVVMLTPIYNQLVDAVSCDIDFLMDTLEEGARKDSFLNHSLRIVKNVYGRKGGEGVGSPGVKKKKVMSEQLRLLLMRQDFLWNKPSAGADTKECIFNALKQVSE